MEKIARIKAHWPVLASAVLLSLAFPPANLSLLSLIALAPLLGYLRNADQKTARRGGYWFGFIYFAFQMFWVFPFVQSWTGSPLMAAIPWVVCAFLAGFFYSATAWLVQMCWAKNRPWAIPLVWVGIEAFRAYIPVLAFPWGIVALPLVHFPVVGQLASVGTVFFVSAWAVLVNVVASVFLFPPRGENFDRMPLGKQTVRMGAVCVALLLGSGLRYITPVKGEKKTFVIGQPGVDMAFTPRAERAPKMTEAAAKATSLAARIGADLTVFPEGFAAGGATLPPESPLGPTPGAPVLFGGNREEGGSTYQSAFAYDGQWQAADKTRLVVFGEFVPFRDVLPFLKGFRLPSGDLTPAKWLTTLDVNKIKVGALICFEGLFPDLAERHSRNGAQVLVQMSIDDWYENTPAYQQLWLSSIWRSIESGLPLVRVGGRGQSLATDARGNIITMLPIGGQDPAQVTLTVPEKSDAFGYRFVFVWLTWLTIAAVAVDAWRGRKKASRGK